MTRYTVLLERPAVDDIEHYYQRAIQAGAPLAAANWMNRLMTAILALEDLPQWRCVIPEDHEFSARLYQIVFDRRYRVIYTVLGDTVHVLCVRGPGLRRLDPSDIQWPAPGGEAG